MYNYFENSAMDENKGRKCSQIYEMKTKCGYEIKTKCGYVIKTKVLQP